VSAPGSTRSTRGRNGGDRTCCWGTDPLTRWGQPDSVSATQQVSPVRRHRRSLVAPTAPRLARSSLLTCGYRRCPAATGYGSWTADNRAVVGRSCFVRGPSAATVDKPRPCSSQVPAARRVSARPRPPLSLPGFRHPQPRSGMQPSSEAPAVRSQSAHQRIKARYSWDGPAFESARRV
jgi:hypothetical protein